MFAVLDHPTYHWRYIVTETARDYRKLSINTCLSLFNTFCNGCNWQFSPHCQPIPQKDNTTFGIVAMVFLANTHFVHKNMPSPKNSMFQQMHCPKLKQTVYKFPLAIQVLQKCAPVTFKYCQSENQLLSTKWCYFVFIFTGCHSQEIPVF